MCLMAHLVCVALGYEPVYKSKDKVRGCVVLHILVCVANDHLSDDRVK